MTSEDSNDQDYRIVFDGPSVETTNVLFGPPEEPWVVEDVYSNGERRRHRILNPDRQYPFQFLFFGMKQFPRNSNR